MSKAASLTATGAVIAFLIFVMMAPSILGVKPW